MGIRLPPGKRRIISSLDNIIYPDTTIVVDWLLGKVMQIGVLQDLEALPTEENDRTTHILDLRDFIPMNQMDIPSEVTAALLAAMTARKAKLAISHELFKKRYWTNGPVDIVKLREHRKEDQAQYKILTGLIGIRQKMVTPQDLLAQISDHDAATVSNESFDTVVAVKDANGLEDMTPHQEEDDRPAIS
ncbi:MAG: hypothetical protein Q9169_006857 [Polycauliona sp. 2 TL-2023]